MNIYNEYIIKLFIKTQYNQYKKVIIQQLNSYLHDIDIRVKEQYDLLVKQLAQNQSITELLKTDNQLLWV